MNQYVINTFVSQRKSNTETAISYYQQKTEALLNSLQTKMINQASSNLQKIQSLDEIFETKLQEISAQMGDLEAFQNKKITGKDIQARVIEYKKAVQSIEEGIENGFQTIQFLQYLQGNDSNIGIGSKLPEVINLQSQQKVLETMVSEGYATASAAGGARARLLGEITEQVIISMLNGNLNEMFGELIASGTAQTKNWAGLTQGKSDALFASMELKLEKMNSGETYGQINNQSVELDLVEALDMESKDVKSVLQQYTTGARGMIGGMTIKQWSDQRLGSRNATIAHSSYTMNLINNRYPNQMISEGFKSKQTFLEYTSYIVSRFLINIIGAYNILVGNASGIETTAKWLTRLVQEKYVLQHSVKMSNGIWQAKDDTIFVAKA